MRVPHFWPVLPEVGISLRRALPHSCREIFLKKPDRVGERKAAIK
jgi:hypothetical protein